MKVIINSNIFVMCLNPISKYNSVFTDLVKGSFKLCISTDISFEYSQIFNQKFHPAKTEMIDRFIRESNHVISTQLYYYWNLITIDPDDNKFID